MINIINKPITIAIDKAEYYYESFDIIMNFIVPLI